jgi:hypothetical protein
VETGIPRENHRPVVRIDDPCYTRLYLIHFSTGRNRFEVLWYLTPLSTIFQLYRGSSKTLVVKCIDCIYGDVNRNQAQNKSTVKPVVRGHIWDKENVVF